MRVEDPFRRLVISREGEKVQCLLECTEAFRIWAWFLHGDLRRSNSSALGMFVFTFTFAFVWMEWTVSIDIDIDIDWLDNKKQ